MQEIIVIFACLYATGCPESREAYFNNKPEVAASLQVQENIIRNALPASVIMTLPAIKAAMDQRVYFKIYKGNITINANAVSVGYVEEF